MRRYAVTAVFEVGPGKVPRGPDVLDRMRISHKATHRFSYCDGRTLTVVIDWTAPGPEDASRDAVVGIRLVWSQLVGSDPGTPLSLRVRPLTPTPKVFAGLLRGAGSLRWHSEGFRGSGDVLLDPGLEVLPDRRSDDRDGPDDPDDGGLAGVREPRRPKPGPGHLSAALAEPDPLI
jgi:hypothetical protein